jgi:uncharacterized integral membrane protein (TIGR00698 family)
MENARATLPGLLLCVALAVIAYLIAQTEFVKETLHFGLLLVVILLGMAVRSLARLPDMFKPGIAFCQKPLLRLAVAGLGFKLSLQELAKIGGPALAAIAATTILALVFGWWIAERLGVGRKLGRLLGVGTSICGASAIVAADSVVQSEKSETACSLGIITLFGTIGILVYPIIGRALSLDAAAYSFWNGASLHEMAQVVAAAETYVPKGLDSADAVVQLSTVYKLARICLLAPVVFWLAYLVRREQQASVEAKVQAVPWFLVVFLLFVALNSLPQFPAEVRKQINDVVTWLLAIGMAGVGLNSGFQDVRSNGWAPVLSGLIQWAFLAAITLGAALLLFR